MNPTAQYQPTDYSTWRLMAWCGPIFLGIFVLFWAILAGNLPPAGADLNADQIKAFYVDRGVLIRIGMSVCMVGAAFYMAWGCAVSKVMRRLEGPDGMLATLEMMGATATTVTVLIACGIWLAGAQEASELPANVVHLLYWMGWLIIDLAYMVTTFQIFGISTVFMRDTREKPLMPGWVNWWGFFTIATFFPVSLIPFVKSGPFAFHGTFNYWIAFTAWYVWVVAVSFNVIRAIGRLQEEDGKAEARAPVRAGPALAAR